jgi:lysophospholipase L1-like esterase
LRIPRHTRKSLEARGMIIPEVRFREAVEAFARADAAAPPPPGGLLFVGDSDIARWRGAGGFEESFAGLAATNRGFGGARTWETAIHFRKAFGAFRPRTIVYCAGDNDLVASPRIGPEHVHIGVEAFLESADALAPRPERFLYLALHTAPRRRGDEARQEATNREIAALCAARPGAEFLDYRELLELPGGGLRAEAFEPDGLHFTPGFYRQWAAWLLPKLRNGL